MRDYCFTRRLLLPFEEVVKAVTDAFLREGFDVLSEAEGDSRKAVRLEVYYRNIGREKDDPRYERWFVGEEEKIAAMLPCNVLIRQLRDTRSGRGGVEVAVVDPITTMGVEKNTAMLRIGGRLREKLMAVVHRL